MRRLFEDAISGEEWDKEKRKGGYSKWMEDKLVDALYNLQLVLDRYRKLQTVPMNNEELVAFRTKVEHFCDITKNWSKKSQKSSTIVATQDRVIPYYAPNSFIKHSKSDSKDRSQEIL
jgi:hypothetical protein